METLYMGEEQIVVKIGEKEKTYPAGVSFLSIAQEYQDQYEDDIVLALYNNRLRELKKTVKKDGELSFLTTSDKTGKRAYRRSVTLLMQKAVYNLWGREHIGVYVRYAIGQGYYCELMKDGESCRACSFREIRRNDPCQRFNCNHWLCPWRLQSSWHEKSISNRYRCLCQAIF